MKTILVVDDELGITEALSLVLEDEGYRAVRAFNGQEGLARMKELLPDLVIVDLMMPVMSGAQLLAQIRSDPTLRRTRVILCSSLSEAIARRHAEGFDAFLQKPCEVREVLAQVHALLDNGRGGR